MSRQHIRIGFALSAAMFLLADAAWSQVIRLRGQNGRVSGLAVSVTDQTANGFGKDVELQVDMTTIRTVFTGDVVMDRGGQRIFEIFTTGEASTQRSGFGGLGDADLSSSFRVSDSPARSFTAFYYFGGLGPIRGTYSGVYDGNALTFTHTSQSYIEGELPAIDYGDGGSPLEVTSLSPYGTPTTSTPTFGLRRITSRWRGSFVHTYPDHGSYTVTAASRCCPWNERGLGDDDTMQQRGLYDVSPGNVVYPNSPSQLVFSNSFQNRLYFTDAVPAMQTQGPARQAEINGTFTTGAQTTGTGGQRFSIAQVTNTVEIADGLGGAFTPQIPSASTYGLALLSLLLAGGGLLVLRR